MARTTSDGPALTLGNRIYLYGLLARELGCGKQTFLPRVEEALASDRMTADDLGFESTRALLEALGDCVNLTIFKGGRIYATVIAQPAWDAALAAPVDAKADVAAKGGKPWKRKKADKSLKPARPRRVKRAAAAAPDTRATSARAAAEKTVAPDTESPTVDQADDTPASALKSGAKVETQATTEPKADPTPKQTYSEADASASESAARAKSPAPDAATASEPQHNTVIASQSKSASEVITEPESSRNATVLHAPESATEPVSAPASADNAAAATKPAPTPQPTISLTVTYDPYSGDEGETTLEATGITVPELTPKPEPASHVNTSTPPKPAPQAKPASNGNADASPAPGPQSKPAQSAQPHPAAPNSEKPQVTAEPHKTLQVSAPAVPPAPATQKPSDTPSAAALASWPRDFAAEVFCSHELIAELTHLLPLGTSAMPLLAQDYRRARDLELVRGTRARATFPLRIEHETSADPILITIRHQRGTGLSWTLTKIE